MPGQIKASDLPDLPSGEVIQNEDLFILVHNGVTYKYPAGLLFAAIGGGGDITAQFWITNIPNPVDGLYHRIKVTMGTDGEYQKEDLGPV